MKPSATLRCPAAAPAAERGRDPHAFSRVTLQLDHHTLHRFEALAVLHPDQDTEALWREALGAGLDLLLRERLSQLEPSSHPLLHLAGNA